MLKRLLAAGGVVLFLSGCSLTASAPVVGGGAGGSVWKSVDGGQSFVPKVTIDATQKISSADVLSLSFDPNDSKKLYIGTVASGIFKTENGGEQWTHAAVPWAKIYSFVVDHADPNRMYVAGLLGNQGKIFRTDDGGADWKEVYTEPGVGTLVLSLAQRWDSPQVIFAGTSAGTVVKSTDSGSTWRNIGTGVDGPVTKIDFDAQEPYTVYLLTFNQKVFSSKDGGANWTDWEVEKQKEQSAKRSKVNQDDPNQGRRPDGIVTIVPDSRVSGTVYAGTEAKGLFVSRDFGKNWTEVNVIESAKKLPIRAIAVNPVNSSEIAFAAGNAFYKSVNGGETWATVQLEIDRSISLIAYDPSDPAVIYFTLRKF